ncbi:MAG: UDP-N-acetylmuramoyl-L-alanyl-D-glutamate--2,6-diaminopimelate ligase [Ancrocorticia sp.]
MTQTTQLADLAALVDGKHIGHATIEGITSDSRAVKSGVLFAAVPGQRVHGARFAAGAIAAGASAIVTDPEGAAMIAADGADVPQLIVDNVSSRLGEIAAQVYGNPARDLRTYAITGTNGKTTTAFLLEYILAAAGRVTGLIGTVTLRLAGHEIPAAMTTPMPADFQRLLADLVSRGGSDLVIEASSHALAQGRTDPVCFDVAGFTNLTQDHLDFHNTFEEYFEAKASLFSKRRSRRAVVCVDDEWGRRLASQAIEELGAANVLALSVKGALPEGLRGWTASSRPGSGHTDITLHSTDGETLRVSTALPGGFNVANVALAVVMALASGLRAENLPSDISPAVPGRMEVVSTKPRVVVDFAHNTDAIIKAMEALRETTVGKLVVVTGAAGERDKGKRPAMGAAVARYADVAIITDDDPHSEDPAAIRRDVLAGTGGYDARVVEIADRCEAIRTAILDAAPEDTILLAGRGHETIQEVGKELIELDDRVEARRALADREADPSQEKNA